MGTNSVGIYRILAILPIWATVMILYLVTDGAMYLGRDIFEGLGYQVAYSAKFGDTMLFGVVFIAATIIKREEPYLRSWFFWVPWLMNGWFHLLVLIGCVALGLTVSVLTLATRSGQMMDVYHDVVIAPMILYFAIALLPLTYYAGTKIEKRWTFFFILIWLVLVIFDIKYDRMNQRQWIERNLGVQLHQNGMFRK